MSSNIYLELFFSIGFINVRIPIFLCIEIYGFWICLLCVYVNYFIYDTPVRTAWNQKPLYHSALNFHTFYILKSCLLKLDQQNVILIFNIHVFFSATFEIFWGMFRSVVLTSSIKLRWLFFLKCRYFPLVNSSLCVRAFACGVYIWKVCVQFGV